MCINLALAVANGVDCTHAATTPPPPIEEATIFLTVYDTALCNAEEVCLQGNGDGYFASMVPVSDDWYGRMAACPEELFGQTLYVLDMTLFCGDTFGTFNGEPVDAFAYHETQGWYVHIDVFWPIAEQGRPYWNAWFVNWWGSDYAISIN